MNILQSKKVNAFGGLNFVHHYLKDFGIEQIFATHLPSLPPQSKYSWKDIFSTFLSIYYCGGQCIEDVNTILKSHFGENPYFKLCSPDILLKSLQELHKANLTCMTKRGSVEHSYNHNESLYKLNIALLKASRIFRKKELVIDYDNTILFAEKIDCKMTYKRDYEYQPGVALVDVNNVLYVENRNGNSDAKSFQHETLERMFNGLKREGINCKLIFRADAASYQYEVINTLEKADCLFYIGAKNSYVEKYFARITNWQKINCGHESMEVGEITFTPFEKYHKAGQTPPEYRLLVKRKPNSTGQVHAFTGDAFEYRAIFTNDTAKETLEAVHFYNQRGTAEKQFDILKNDFGWSHLPYSHLSFNCVFLYMTAICRNLYNKIIEVLGAKFQNIQPTDRMKRFVFTFITKPAVWVKKARQWHLRIYGELQLRV